MNPLIQELQLALARARGCVNIIGSKDAGAIARTWAGLGWGWVDSLQMDSRDMMRPIKKGKG